MRLVEKTFSKNSLLCSMFYIFLQCSPGRSSPSFQLLVMNPGFFMPFRKVSKKKSYTLSFSSAFHFSFKHPRRFGKCPKQQEGITPPEYAPKVADYWKPPCGVQNCTLRQVLEYLPQSTLTHSARHRMEKGKRTAREQTGGNRKGTPMKGCLTLFPFSANRRAGVISRPRGRTHSPALP